jgi:hypothetical protein
VFSRPACTTQPLSSREQYTSRLGQDHPRKAPPIGDAAAVDVVLEVVALLSGEFDRAFLRLHVEPSMVLRRQVLVGEVIESEAPYRPAHRAELLVDGVVIPELVELMQAASELANAR